VEIDTAHGGKYLKDFGPGQAIAPTLILTFSSVENIGGGGATDFFLMAGRGSIGSIDGGSNGQDVIDYSHYSCGVTVNLDAGTATGVGSIVNVENIKGSQYDDILIGSNDSNEIHGKGGNDIVIGLDGNDALYGEVGRDLLIGGLGADHLYGGGDQDILIGGRTTLDANSSKLHDILTVWAGTGSLDITYASYDNRLKVLRQVLGASVLGDSEVDTLLGGEQNGYDTSLDWFWRFSGDTTNLMSPELHN
jgi:Ca2+-binding RTX toxin-like protein